MTILIKIPGHVFVEVDKLILKFILDFKGPAVAKRILKKNILRRFDLSAFKIFYKSGVVKQVCFSVRIDRSMEQIENLEVNPQIYTQLIFDKDTKAIQWRKE